MMLLIDTIKKWVLIWLIPCFLVFSIEIRQLLAVQINQNYSDDLLRAAKSAQMKSYMDEKVAPCENFYNFACGNWPTIHSTKANSKSSNLDDLRELYWRKILKLLKELQISDSTADMKVKDFYESCHIKGDLSKFDLENIFQNVELSTDWPQNTNYLWYESEYDWLRTIAVIRRKMGVNILIGLNIIADFDKPVIDRIMVGAPDGLDLLDEINSNSSLVDDKQQQLRDAHLESVQSLLSRYFPEMSKDWCLQIAKQVQEIEINLSRGVLRTNLHDKRNIHLRPVSDLRASYGSYIDIPRYLRLIFNQSIYTPIYEGPENYFTNLIDVIRLTPKLTLANYTMWKILQYIDKNSPPATAAFPMIEEWCVQKTMEYFPKNLEKMYLRNYETIKMLDQLQTVWSDIKNTFRYHILSADKLTWMSSDTRQNAVDKLSNMDLEYTTLISDNMNLQIEKLVIRQDRYYENLMRLLQWQTAQQLEWPIKHLRQEGGRRLEETLPLYNIRTNKIKIPTQFLQNRFFWDNSYPHALLYSTLGYLLAQQMLKGFDLRQSNYDRDGFRRQWWDNNSEYAYNNRSNCFEIQYANYAFPGWIKNDSKALLSTYITENGALNLAYQAYQQWWHNIADTKQNEGEFLEYSLPNYKQNQLFFIGFAQLWCASYNNLNDFKDLPEQWRVIGSLANRMEFAEEFQCPSGTLMNPIYKCLLF